MGLLHTAEAALHHGAAVEREDRERGFAFGVVEEHPPAFGSACDAHRFERGRRTCQTVDLADAEGFFQTLIGVDQAVAVARIPSLAVHFGVLARGLLQNLDHLLVGEVGIGLQPQGNRAGHEGRGLRSAFHQSVPRFVFTAAHRCGQQQVLIVGIEALRQLVLRTVDERTGGEHCGLGVFRVEKRTDGGETRDVAQLLFADFLAFVVEVRGIAAHRDGAGDRSGAFAHDKFVVGLQCGSFVPLDRPRSHARAQAVAVHPNVEGFVLRVVGRSRDLEPDLHVQVVAAFFVFVARNHGVVPSGAQIQEVAVQFALVVGVDRAEFAALIDHFFPIFVRLRQNFSARIEEGCDGEMRFAVGGAAPNVHIGVELVVGFPVDHALEVGVDEHIFRFARGQCAVGVEVLVAFVAHGRRDEAAAAAQQAVDALIIVRAAVVGPRLAAETHVHHPRLLVLLGIVLDEFHVLHDFRVVKRRGNHNDVGFRRHALEAVARVAARGDIGHVCGVAGVGFRAVGPGGDHGGGGGVFVLGGVARIGRTVPKHLHARIFRRGVEEGRVAEFKTLVDDADHDAATRERGVQAGARVHLGHARIGARFVERRAETTRESEVFHLVHGGQAVERGGGHGGRHHAIGDHHGRSAQCGDAGGHGLGAAFGGGDVEAQGGVDVHHAAPQTEVSGGAVDGAAGGARQRGATLHDLTDGGIHLVRTGGLLSRAV